MHKLSLFLYIALLYAILSACSSTKEITIETLEKGEVSIPIDKQSMVILPNTLAIDTQQLIRYVEGDIPAKNLETEEMCYYESIIGIANRIEKAEHFSRLRIACCDTAYLRNDKINWNQVIKAANTYQSDICLLIDLPEHALKMEPYFMTEFEDGSPVQIQLFAVSTAIKVRYLLLDPEQKTIIDSMTYQAEDRWETGMETRIKTESYLEDFRNLLAGFAYDAAFSYGQRIFPHWVTNYRMLYVAGNKSMKKAYHFSQENAWDEAIILWENMYKSENNSLSAKAAYNLAVANEVNGLLWKARLWAMRSYRKQETEESAHYVNLLYERIQYYKQSE
jgi:hypothetical protein